MSYEIVKGIKIDLKNKCVMIKSDSNNVCPKYFKWKQSKYFTDILVKHGKEETIKHILEAYWNGSFKKTGNSYEYSLILLDNSKFNYENLKSKEDYANLREELYRNYLLYKKREIGKYVVFYTKYNSFVSKFLKHSVELTSDIKNAKSFTSKEEALAFTHNRCLKGEIDIQKVY